MMKLFADAISIGLAITSVTAFFTHNVADAIYFLVMALWLGQIGKGEQKV